MVFLSWHENISDTGQENKGQKSEAKLYIIKKHYIAIIIRICTGNENKNGNQGKKRHILYVYVCVCVCI